MDDASEHPVPFAVLFRLFLMSGAAVMVTVVLGTGTPFCGVRYWLDVSTTGALVPFCVVVLHECLHLVVYRVAGCAPYLKGRRLKLSVGARKEVPRHLLLVQLRAMPLTAIVLSVFLGAAVSLAQGFTALHVFVVCVLVALSMCQSGYRDLLNHDAEKNPDACWFWDRGDSYPVADWPSSGPCSRVAAPGSGGARGPCDADGGSHAR